MVSLALFGLVCIGIGALAATVGMWTAGMFELAQVADDNTDHESDTEEWPFPTAPYNWDDETAA